MFYKTAVLCVRFHVCLTSVFYPLVEQKHPSEPGHSRGAGSHLGAPCPAPPHAEPQAAAGTDRPAAGRADPPAGAAEPGAPRRGANQALRCHGGHRCRYLCLVQWQGSEGSLEALAEQRQEGHQHVRRGLRAAGQLSSSGSHRPLDTSN